jgi:hypothetical protein
MTCGESRVAAINDDFADWSDSSIPAPLKAEKADGAASGELPEVGAGGGAFTLVAVAAFAPNAPSPPAPVNDEGAAATAGLAGSEGPHCTGFAQPPVAAATISSAHPVRRVPLFTG